MATQWCEVCGGQGFLDEEGARAIGLSIVGGRTTICPVCDGTGEPAARDPRGCALVILGVAVGWALPGAVLYWVFHR